MNIRDTIFADAVAAIDAGDVPRLDSLITQHSHLVADRLQTDEPGYFADPYLLWFVAENPIRNGRLPANIADVAMAIVDHIDQQGLSSRQVQIDYAVSMLVIYQEAKDEYKDEKQQQLFDKEADRADLKRDRLRDGKTVDGDEK